MAEGLQILLSETRRKRIPVHKKDRKTRFWRGGFEFAKTEKASDRQIPETVCKYQLPGGEMGSVPVHVCPP